MWQIGTARRDITACIPGVGMMGYVKEGNCVEGVESPLFARATVLVAPGGARLALVLADICFITLAIREGVLARLGWAEHEVLLTATHTHSAPGGYSHYFFYNVSVPGFAHAVYETVVDGIVEAIREAERTAAPGALRLAAGEFPPEQEVAFNRSLAAYNANPDVTPRSPGDRHLAVDREMTLVRLEDAEGQARGLLSWFACHATNVHNDNRLISADNKGYAASICEAAAPGFVASFCQGAAGDVSPNYQRLPGRPFPCGKYADDFASARHNGELQAAMALALLEAASSAPAIAPVLDAAVLWADLADVAVDPAFTGGRSGCRTAPAAIGAPMLGGTAEGPGAPPPVIGLAALAASAYKARLRKRAAVDPEAERLLEAHGAKALVVEMGAGRVFGTTTAVNWLPGWVDAVVRHLKEHHAAGTIGPQPWTPHVLPLQLVIVGHVALAATPAEFTTQAGRRLKATLLSVLAARGVERVVVTGYANAYSGYVTTPEEYDVQLYEGASTHFGKWTLPAYQMLFDRLARELLKPAAERRLEATVRPPTFSPEEIARRAYRHAL